MSEDRPGERDVSSGVYGDPPSALVPVAAGAVQYSPLIPGAAPLESAPVAAHEGFFMAAPPGAAERRYVLALALRTLAAGATLIAAGRKDRGGARLRKDLEGFGCQVEECAKAHHRICTTRRPAVLEGLETAIANGGPRLAPALGLWSQPGVFSWDRIDPGSALLARHLSLLEGDGADLGCGIGVLARAALGAPKVRSLALIDIDRRAVDAARRNIDDGRASFAWADATGGEPASAALDFVVTNPPFHDGGREDRALGQRFIRRAHEMLRRSGTLWLVANRHLPYEAVLTPLFSRVERRADSGGYKVFEARK